MFRLTTAILVACCVCSATVIAAENPNPNPNTATVSRVAITPTGTAVTFKLNVLDATQPTRVQIAATSANSLTDILSTVIRAPKNEVLPIQITATAGSAGKPHTLDFTLPAGSSGGFDYIVTDNSMSASPRYQVQTINLETTVSADLMIKNDSPNEATDITLSFQGWGIDWTEDHRNLSTGTLTIVPAKKVVSKEPLAYWVFASKFKDQAGKASLQFPMKGNWPKELTQPGSILFRYESTQLASFVQTGSTPAERTKSFQDAINSDTPRLFSEPKPIDVTSRSEYVNVITTDWPLIGYQEKVFYTAVGTESALVRVDEKTVIRTGESKPAEFSRSLQLNLFPGQQDSTHLQEIRSKVELLVSQSPELKFEIAALDLIQPLVKEHELQVEESTQMIGDLNTSPADAAAARAKLKYARKSIDDIFESYNAWVKNRP